MKARIRTFINNIFFTPKPLPEGTYQGYYKLPDGQTCRLHLRLDPLGDGLLVLNASTILHLNPSASEFAYHIIQGSSEQVITSEMVKRYRATAEQVKTDLDTFIGRLESLILMPDLDPESFLDIDRLELHQDHLTAPLRLDCALTYQTPGESSAVYTPINRVKRLLETSEWKTILQKAWNKGILHVVFTGGEPTIRPDLPELIAQAEQLGLVSGLITDGLRLSEKGYLDSLLQAGLDHIMLVLDPKDTDSWEVLTDIVHEDISLTVHLTITDSNLATFDSVLKKLVKAGVQKVSLSANSEAVAAKLAELTRKIHENGLSLVWDMPVPYSEMNPVALEIQNNENTRKGAARSWLYVEPDGDVLPAQGIDTVLGNLLTDSWEKIWSAAKLWVNESK
jgi:organic radical activating enzyme